MYLEYEEFSNNNNNNNNNDDKNNNIPLLCIPYDDDNLEVKIQKIRHKKFNSYFTRQMFIKKMKRKRKRKRKRSKNK